MPALTPEYVEYEHWTAAAFAFTVECSREVLSEIDRIVTAGFNEIPRGGVEVGGVLFGQLAGSVIRILAFRPVVCEYASGPSYRLSERDQASLARVLSLAPADPELQGMVPVGWYHSHTRTGISLRDEDIEVFNRHFPETWQVSLVLRPRQFDLTRGAFFFRDAGGAVSPEPAGEFAVVRDTRPQSVRPEQPATAYPRDLRPPMPERPQPRHRARESHAWIWLLTAAALLAPAIVWFAPLAFWRNTTVTRPPARAALRLSDLQGHLIIHWDPQAPPVLEADSGHLDIADGPDNVRLDLDRAQLASGRAVYTRSSGNTAVRLVLRRPGAPDFEESTRFVGMPPAPPPDLPQRLPAIDARTVPPLPEPPEVPERAKAKRKREREIAAAAPVKRPFLRSFVPPAAKRSPAQSSAAAIDAPRLEVTAANGVQEPLPGVQPQTVVRPAPPPPPPPAPAPAPVRPRAAPASGQMIWTGRLEKHGIVEVDGSQASRGHLSGALPGTPVTITVMPGELTPQGLRLYVSNLQQPTRFEAAGPQNGWNPTVYVRDPARAYEITVLEAPSEANGWKHLSLRAEERSYSVIVLRWRSRE